MITSKRGYTDDEVSRMRTVIIRVFGRVQGVGFRYFTQQKAADFSINGWVRNLKDSSVEIVAQGNSESINFFLQALNIGPRPYAKVTKVEVQDIENEDRFTRFEIRH